MSGYLMGALGIGGPEPFFEVVANNPSAEASGAPYSAEITQVSVAGKVASATLVEKGFLGMDFIDFFHLIEEDGQYFIYVCPKNMSVKFGKTRHANFIPLPEDIIENVIRWRDYLHSLGFSDADPLFPKIDNLFARANLLEQTIKKEEIKSNTTIRDIFKKAFENAGFEYIRPHSFRRTLARYAETQSPAFLNAVRQNLGHKSIDTTLSSYGQQSVAEQRRNISSVQLVMCSNSE